MEGNFQTAAVRAAAVNTGCVSQPGPGWEGSLQVAAVKGRQLSRALTVGLQSTSAWARKHAGLFDARDAGLRYGLRDTGYGLQSGTCSES